MGRRRRKDGICLPVLLVAGDGHFISWTLPKIWENLAWKCAERRLHQVVLFGRKYDGMNWLGWDESTLGLSGGFSPLCAHLIFRKIGSASKIWLLRVARGKPTWDLLLWVFQGLEEIPNLESPPGSNQLVLV